MENIEKLTITLGPDRTLKLNLRKINEEIDIDSILKIDYSQLVAEIATFDVIVNKAALLLADMDNRVSESKLDFDIFEAKSKEVIRVKLTETDEKGKEKKPTISEVEDTIKSLPEYKAKKIRMFNIQKQRDYIASFYFSARSKSSKLEKLSQNIKTGDMENKLVEGQINGMLYKVIKPLID